MIYSKYIIQTYSFDLAENYDIQGNTPYYAFLLRDGTIDYRFDDSGFPDIIGESYYTLVDYLNEHYYSTYVAGQNYNADKELMAVFVANYQTNDYAIINTSSIDFNIYTPFEGGLYSVFYGKPHQQEWIFDGDPVIYDYSGQVYNSVVQSSNALSVADDSNYNHVVLDYYNIVTDIPYYQEFYTSRVGSYYNNFHYSNNFLKMNASDGFTMALGSLYESIRKEGYDNGYANGYSNGYDEGYTNGSRLTDGGVHDGFSYLTEGFNAVANIMSLEVLPNITLGIAFSIPLTLVLIMTIFKLVRK